MKDACKTRNKRKRACAELTELVSMHTLYSKLLSFVLVAYDWAEDVVAL